MLTLIVLLALYGVAPIKPSPLLKVGEFDSLKTLSTLENISFYRAVNIWIGPSQLSLIQLGAKFTPCMRNDFGITTRNARVYIDEETDFGCCENQGLVGTSRTTECIAGPRGPINNETKFTKEQRCSNFSVAGVPNLHPCCISILGHCGIMRMDECEARGGIYHIEQSDCQQVSTAVENGGRSAGLMTADSTHHST